MKNDVGTPQEKWVFYKKELEMSRYYEFSKILSNENYSEIQLDEYGHCSLTVIFNKGVSFLFLNTEFSSVIRELDVYGIVGRDIYWEWPIFEIFDSSLMQTIISLEQAKQLGLRHFVISTESMIIDVFATYDPEIILNNKENCSAEYHKFVKK